MKIPISNRPGLYELVDDEDYFKVSMYIWTYANGYVSRSKRRSEKRGVDLGMHRIVTGCPPDMCVHHINHDKLDNRKGNLQICTRAENSAQPYPRPPKKIKPQLVTIKFKIPIEKVSIVEEFLQSL